MSIFDRLSKILPGGKERSTQKEFHLALELMTSYVKASLWTLENQSVRIWGTGLKEFETENWEKALEAADEAIALSCENFSAEISKVMFGLPEDWVEEEKIKEPYFSQIKKISKELELEPLAFVAIPEAISYYLKQQEGSPLTAILVGIEKDDVDVTLIRVGKVDGTKPIKRSSETLGFDVEKTLSLFPNVEVFPPRILLYGEGDLTRAQSELLSHQWVKNSLFIHFPKVEILPKDIDIHSVVLAGGLDLGKRAGTEIFGIPVINDQKTEEEKGDYVQAVEKEEEKVETPADVAEEVKSDTEPEDTTALKEEETAEAEKSETVEDLGFVRGGDFAQLHNISLDVPDTEETPVKEEEVKGFTEEVTPAILEVKEKVPLQQRLKQLTSKLPKVSLPHIQLPKNGLMLVAAIVLVLLFVAAGGVWAYWNVPKATVRLLVEPKPLENDTTVSVNPAAVQLNMETKEIPGRIATVTSKGAKKGAASGKKMVGDKAKGEVTVYNKTISAKTFPSGTIIVGSNNLKFTLDNEVNVASASEELGVTVHGKTKASVTAFDIGTDANMAAGNDFTFKEFGTASYYAHNDQAFSGGSSRQVMVVSDADQRRLEATLSAELTEKGKSDLHSQIGQEERMVDKGVVTQLTSEKFDKKVDEEGNEVNLSMEMTSKATVFSDATMKEFIKNISKGNVPEGYELKESEVSYTSEFVKKGEGDAVQLNVHYKVNLVPVLDTEKIKKDLVGKNEAVAEDYLNRQPQLAGFGIKITPKLPKFLNTLPRNAKNITIEVAPR